MGEYLGVASDEVLRKNYGLSAKDLQRLDRGSQLYEQGKLPEGKTALVGRPPLADEEIVTVAFKLAKSKRDSLDRQAQKHGESRSEFIRTVIDQALASS